LPVAGGNSDHIPVAIQHRTRICARPRVDWLRNTIGISNQNHAPGNLDLGAQQRVGKRIAGMIERLDKNGDGLLSRDEMQMAGRGDHKDRTGKMFERFDEDGSGGISQQEFDEAKAQMGERHKGRSGGHGSKD